MEAETCPELDLEHIWVGQPEVKKAHQAFVLNEGAILVLIHGLFSHLAACWGSSLPSVVFISPSFHFLFLPSWLISLLLVLHYLMLEAFWSV